MIFHVLNHPPKDTQDLNSWLWKNHLQMLSWVSDEDIRELYPEKEYLYRDGIGITSEWWFIEPNSEKVYGIVFQNVMNAKSKITTIRGDRKSSDDIGKFVEFLVSLIYEVNS